MTNYFVRKTGSDAAAGTSAGAAWLTVDKAANTVAAGDTVYIGAGVYRELVTMDTSGTSGSVISYIADIDGSQTGDPGLVIISAFGTDTATSTRVNCLDMTATKFITWQDVIFDGGSGQNVLCAGTGHDTYEGIIFDGCVFLAEIGTGTTIYFDFNQATTPATAGPIFRNCSVNGAIVFAYDENSSANNNIKATVENCLFTGFGRLDANAQCAIRLSPVGTTGTFGANGIAVNNCTIVGYETGVLVHSVVNITTPLNLANNLFIGCQNAVIRLIGTAGSAVSLGDNFVTNFGIAFTGLSAHANDDFTGSFSMLGGIADLPLYRRLGWSPFKPWEPISMSGYISPLIGAANATSAPATDIYGNPRPMGRADDVGAVESRARPQRESTTVRTGTYAARFEGAGYYDVLRPVAASSTTISAYGQFDANYTGSKPKLEVFEIPGVADQSDIMTGASGAFEQISVTFTPTSAGWVRIRLSSQDASATGQCFFDDLEVV